MDVRGERIASALQAPIINRRAFRSIRSMRGRGAPCDGCGMRIEAEDVQYELEYCDTTQSVTIKLHRECWEAWRT